MKDKVIFISIIVLIIIDLVYWVSTKNLGSQTPAVPEPVSPAVTQTPPTPTVGETPNPIPDVPPLSTGRPSIDASKVHYEDD